MLICEKSEKYKKSLKDQFYGDFYIRYVKQIICEPILQALFIDSNVPRVFNRFQSYFSGLFSQIFQMYLLKFYR